MGKKDTDKTEVSPMVGLGAEALALVKEAEGIGLVPPGEEKGSRGISLPPPSTYREVMKKTE